MADREKNFVSAVVYMGEEKDAVRPFLQALCDTLGSRFEQYELVFVNDASRDGTLDEVRDFIAQREGAPPVTIIHMSLRQGRELAMNAGMDMAIGDFVYEFDSMQMPYDASLITDAYDACVAGSDIVSAAPSRNRNFWSALFYRLFNSSSGSKYKLQTDTFRVLSRRAINRVHSISDTIPYRKATYAACGLKMETLYYKGNAGKLHEELRVSRAVDSLALYTNTGYKISLGVSVFMLALMIIAVAYTIIMFAVNGAVIEGWTTTMLITTGGFFGVFLVLAMVLKYLSLLVELVFKKQNYLVESVEKLK